MMISIHTTLYLRVSEAKGLLAKDLNGKSDPYCVVKVDNVIIARTATVYKTLDPMWGELFILHMPNCFQNLSLYIYDADKVSGDDIIGTVSIARETLNEQSNPKGLESWFSLQKANKDLEIQGEILLEYGIRTSEATGLSNLFVAVIEGRDLAPKDKTGYSDPYVSVTCLDETKFTTRQKKTRFPEWNETMEFLLPENSTYSNLSIIVTAWDKDRLSSDDFMGQVILGADDVTHGTVKKWHAVTRRPHFDAVNPRRGSCVDRGKVRLRLQLLEVSVLPSSCYQPLVDLTSEALSDKKVGYLLWDLLFEERSMELNHLAAALVRFYLAQEAVIDFLDRLIVRDIKNTDNPNTVFRGNSLCTKSVDQYMKLLGIPYLQDTLQPIIERIFSEKKTVELDPSRLSTVRRRHSLYWDAEENFLQSSVDAILGYMTEVVDCIVRSVPSCPLALRIVLRNVYLQASAKWPCCTHEDIPYIAVSGFIFLRFFVPAILSPKLFSLHDLHPSHKIHRTLTIMAKVTQNLGNLAISPSCKESWMEPLFPFINANIIPIRNFLEELISVNVEDADSLHLLARQQSNDTILMQGRLYLCHYHCHRLFCPIVLKKCQFCLTRAMLSYSKSPDDGNEQTMVLVENICAVEPLDYGALGKSSMAQIIHRTSDNNVSIIYFQAKDVNSQQAWISAIRKTCRSNSCRVDTFHPGVFTGSKWNCCRREQDVAAGCSQTYNGVVLGDWQDPLDPGVDAEIVYSQLQNSRETLRKQQHILHLRLTQEDDMSDASAEEMKLSERLQVLSRFIDVIDQIAMSHDAFQEL